MSEFNSYMVHAIVETHIEGERGGRRLPAFFLRSDFHRTAPTTAQEACTEALSILSAMVTPTSGITAITVAVGSLDNREDAAQRKKHFPSGRTCQP